MAIHDRRISILNCSGVVQHNDLGVEVLALFGWIILRVGSNISSANFFDGHILDIEANVVTWKSFWERLVVQLDRFDLGGDISRSKSHDHARLDNTSLNTTNGHCSNASPTISSYRQSSSSSPP